MGRASLRDIGIHYGDGLTRCAGVVAGVSRRPGPGHTVVVGASPLLWRRIAEGQTRILIARIRSTRGGEARHGWTLDRARWRQRTDIRRMSVLNRDGLTRCAGVVARVSRRPGPGYRVVVGAGTSCRRIGKGQCRTA